MSECSRNSSDLNCRVDLLIDFKLDLTKFGIFMFALSAKDEELTIFLNHRLNLPQILRLRLLPMES